MSDINTITFKLEPTDGYHFDNNGLEKLIKLVKENAKKYEILDENPHAELIAQYEQDEIDYPDFYLELWQVQGFDKSWGTQINPLNWHISDKYRRHPHRESIIAWHKCSDEDKKRWEYKPNNEDKWIICHSGTLKWYENCMYRLRPIACKITLQDGTVMEYPEPVRYSLNYGDIYYAIDDIKDYSANEEVWKNDSIDHKWLKSGIIHLTEQAAQQHLEVLQAINAQKAI